MARRSQIYQQIPWIGGINTSVESGVLPPQDLTICDNVTLLSSGIKRKREGFEDWDANSDVPAVTHRASSGTTRTITFASTLTPSATEKLSVGESITVAGTHATEIASYNGTFVITGVSGTTLTYTGVGSLSESTTATSTITLTRTYPLVHLTDFWYNSGGAQVQQIVGVTSQPMAYYYSDSGKRQACTGSITSRVGTSVKVNSLVFNNSLVIFNTRTGNVPIKWSGSTQSDLAATAPDASMGAIWLSRIWCNNKASPHRIEYSATGSLSDWGGTSDSGAIDIRPGDGDPDGITGIFPFKGSLFVSKRTKLYRITGDSPENFVVTEVSTALGIENHSSICPVDQQDIFYVSNKGVHNLTTTANFGDLEGSFVSSKIQPSFNDWEPSRLAYTQATYLPGINSIAFSVAETQTTRQDTVWLYNTQLKEWYRWPEISAQCVATALMSNKLRMLIGTQSGKIIRVNNNTYTDYGTTAIRYRIKTGIIYPDNSPISLKAFKRLILFFRPKSSYSFSVRVKIDAFSEQSLGFSNTANGDILGTDFVLGQSILGTDRPFVPHAVAFDGYGHGVTIDIEQTGTGEQVDIYGFAIEYETADFSQEGGSTNESGE